ncbi:SDR family NAD(P)-dependent oxidoreductase [Halovulum sp. GXIMD14794]
MAPPIADQRVCITGAAHGLGAAIARAFAAKGARLVLMDFDRSALEASAETLNAEAQLICADLSDPYACQEAIRTMMSDPAPVDTLIHNAAILRPEPFEAVTFGTYQATVNVGLQAGFQLAQSVWPAMKARGGALVFVSSQSGIKGFADETAYCAAKHGLEGLSKCLALEGAAHGVLSCTITPGKAMRTPMSEQNYPPELKATWVEPDALTPAFIEIAETRNPAFNGQRLNAWGLSSAKEPTE